MDALSEMRETVFRCSGALSDLECVLAIGFGYGDGKVGYRAGEG